MALTITIQGGTPPLPTTPLAGGAFNGIGANVATVWHFASLQLSWNCRISC